MQVFQNCAESVDTQADAGEAKREGHPALWVPRKKELRDD